MPLLRTLVCCSMLLAAQLGHQFGRADLLAAQPRPAAQDEFVPVTDVPESEQISAIRLIATAYGFIWVVLLGYVWTVGKRLRTVESELDALQRRSK